MPSDPLPPPRLVRLLGTDGHARFAAVTADAGGVPVELVDLAGLVPELAGPVDGPFDLAALRQALALAELVTRSPEATTWDSHRQTLAEDELPARLLSPLALGQDELDRDRRVVLAAGLNYGEHKAETGTRAEGLLLFAKPVVPTGAFAPVPATVPLLDYEVEIGLVLLADLDLDAQPSPEQLLDQVAFVLANDVSDREPIILDPVKGYTRGKSRPGFLVLGPWLVPGRQLAPRLGAELGRQALDLRLSIRRAGEAGWTVRQTARSDEMIAGPLAILRAAAATRASMPDLTGRPRFLYPEDRVLRAGSLILTGTPGGTAIQAPRPHEKLLLFVRGGFTRSGATRRFLADQLAQARRLGYLAPGDAVDATAFTTEGGSGLGRQRWHVAGSGEGAGARAVAPQAENDP